MLKIEHLVEKFVYLAVLQLIRATPSMLPKCCTVHFFDHILVSERLQRGSVIRAASVVDKTTLIAAFQSRAEISHLTELTL